MDAPQNESQATEMISRSRSLRSPESTVAKLLRRAGIAALLTIPANGCIRVDNMQIQPPAAATAKNNDQLAAESEEASSNASVFKGTIVPSPKDQSVVNPLPGRDYTRLVGTGDKVKAGQKLLQYDASVIREFQVAWENLQAFAENARVEWERDKKLHEEKALPDRELEAAAANYFVQQNNAEEAENRLKKVMDVTAKNDGTVSIEGGTIRINGKKREVIVVVPLSIDPRHAVVTIGESQTFPATMVFQEPIGADKTSLRVTLNPDIAEDAELPMGSVDVRFIPTSGSSSEAGQE